MPGRRAAGLKGPVPSGPDWAALTEWPHGWWVEGPRQAAVTPVALAGGDPGARCHGRRTEFPLLHSNFLVFRGKVPAPPL